MDERSLIKCLNQNGCTLKIIEESGKNKIYALAYYGKGVKQLQHKDIECIIPFLILKYETSDIEKDYTINLEAYLKGNKESVKI